MRDFVYTPYLVLVLGGYPSTSELSKIAVRPATREGNGVLLPCGRPGVTFEAPRVLFGHDQHGLVRVHSEAQLVGRTEGISREHALCAGLGCR